jgi:hypothetical protein
VPIRTGRVLSPENVFELGERFALEWIQCLTEGVLRPVPVGRFSQVAARVLRLP